MINDNEKRHYLAVKKLGCTGNIGQCCLNCLKFLVNKLSYKNYKC